MRNIFFIFLLFISRAKIVYILTKYFNWDKNNFHHLRYTARQRIEDSSQIHSNDQVYLCEQEDSNTISGIYDIIRKVASQLEEINSVFPGTFYLLSIQLHYWALREFSLQSILVCSSKVPKIIIKILQLHTLFYKNYINLADIHDLHIQLTL